MISDADVIKLKTVFATKDDIKPLSTELSRVHLDVTILRNGMSETKKAYSRMEIKVDDVLNKLDKFVGNIAGLEQENKMGARTLHRHDVQIHELATATGTTISE